MFDAVPRRYDLINRLFTFRLDERWRARAAGICLREEPRRVLDLGCGTGDLALHLARRAGAGTEVIGADFSEPVLEAARAKATAAGLDGRVSFASADASELPFTEAHFDAVGIAFAFRNLTWRNPLRERYLSEVLRVLTPGGRFVIVESSQPGSSVLRSLVHWYLRVIVTRLGGAISGRRGAYRYLAESARKFHPPEEVTSMLLGAGFSRVDWRRLMGGVAAIHVARK